MFYCSPNCFNAKYDYIKLQLAARERHVQFGSTHLNPQADVVTLFD